MVTIGDTQQLLDRVDAVSHRYRQAQQDPRYQFNIFTILRQADDEVSLHSRFLTELLDPRGQHLQGSTFLALFLQRVGIEGLDVASAVVRREYSSIDILITDDEHAVIIENKINATDQLRQLERYYQTIRQKGYDEIEVIYLTRYGDAPSDQSVGSLDRDLIRLVSYADDIHVWVGECIERTAQHPAVSEVLLQYQRVIERLTGQSLSKRYIMEIKELLIDEKNIELATHISQALAEAKIEVQWSFWQELDRQLREAGLQIVDDQPCYNSYSRRKVERWPKSGYRHYGVTMKLADYDQTTELLFYFRIGLYNLYCGFSVTRDGGRDIADEARFDSLAELVSEFGPTYKRTKYSIGTRDADLEVDFRQFSNATTFSMADAAKRRSYVGELVQAIRAEVTRFLEMYDGRRATSRADREQLV